MNIASVVVDLKCEASRQVRHRGPRTGVPKALTRLAYRRSLNYERGMICIDSQAFRPDQTSQRHRRTAVQSGAVAVVDQIPRQTARPVTR